MRFKDVLDASSESDIAEIENLQSSIAPDSCFSIQFTSGTTGKPKAARLSHFSVVNCGYDMGKTLNEIFSRIVANAFKWTIYASGKRHELDKNSNRICVNNPLFHGYGIIITIMNCLNHGATMVLPSPHFNAEDSLEAILKERCNVVFGTPTSKWIIIWWMVGSKWVHIVGFIGCVM